jgi:hypothetical protein
MPRRSRSGEYVVLGCLFAPGALLLLAAILIPGNGAHGNFFIVIAAVLALIVAAALTLLQLALPKPKEPPDSSEGSFKPPEG